MFEEADFLI